MTIPFEQLTLSPKPWRWFSALVFIVLIKTAAASELSYSGFISQGLVYTTDNNFYGESEDLSYDFTEIGVNALWQINNKVSLFGQVLSRRAGELENGDLKIDYLGLDFSLYQSALQSFNLRVGRVKNMTGLYNETRDVAFTRSGIFLPQSIYFDLLRDLQLSSDGLTGHWELSYDAHKVSLEFGAGKPRPDEDTEINFVSLNSSNSRFDDEEISQARLWTEFNHGTWVAALSYYKGGFDIDIDDDLVTPLSDGFFKIEAVVASLQYNQEYWSITGEVANLNALWDLGLVVPNSKLDTRSKYLQFEYRLREDLTLLARRDVMYFNKFDKDGLIYEQFTGFPGYTQYAKDLTMGVRWQLNQSWLFMLEYHDVKGAGWLSSRENLDRSQYVKEWALTSLLVSYRF